MSREAALKKELARVKAQRNEAQEALAEQVYERGYFNPYWGKPEFSFLDDGLGFDEPANRTLDDSPQATYERASRVAIYKLSRKWLRLKEWDLLTSNAQRPERVEKLSAAFLGAEYEAREAAKEIADAEFKAKHPGFYAEGDSWGPLRGAAVLACWAAEDRQ